MSTVESLGRFDGPAELPAPWGEVPYLLSNHGDSAFHSVWTVPGALVTLTGGTGRPLGLLGLGDPDGAARILASHDVAEAISALPPQSVRWFTVPQGTMDRSAGLLAGPLAHLGGRGEWEWMWTGGPLVGADAEGVERLAASAEVAREVQEFLAVAHPTSDTEATDPRIFGWWAVREAGRLCAVVGAMRFAPGLAPYLVSLGVDPDHRGRGLAGRVLAAAVRDGLDDALRLGRGVSLALYSANERARRVYVRHGFELHHRFESLRDLRP